MYKYFPHTKQDVKEMLEKVNLKNIDDLFLDIPDSAKYNGELDLPNYMSELELRRHAQKLGSKNKKLVSFLGAGSYDVYTPSIIKSLTSRQEFLTSYTPYQPEISQGTLQYIFEFQSIICELTNMDVSNASVYDGATASAEAMFMAHAQTKKKKILVSDTVSPRTIDVLKTYGKYRGLQIEIVESIQYSISESSVKNKLNDDVACLIVQNPNYYGIVEEYDNIVEILKTNKSLFIMNVDPSTLSVLKTPGEIGADIVCGDAQTLGIPLSYGGPYLGFMATTNKLLRKLPGRIIGMTNDVDGKRGFVLTLQAREQHIRREKANSNICSNQSLMALHASIYVNTMGPQGLIDVAKQAYSNSHYFFDRLLKTNRFFSCSTKPFFKEFIVKTNINISGLNKYLLKNEILGGLDLGDGKYLLCATEVRTKNEIDQFISLVEEYDDVQ